MENQTYLNTYKTMGQRINYITVTLELKESQKQADNKWLVTIDGEKRLVTYHTVCFHILDLKDVKTKFKLEEVESFKIEYKEIKP